MSAHTLGPWLIGQMLPGNTPAVIGDGDSVVAILPGRWNGCSYIEANAHLIAAAPELLEALIECVVDMGATESFYGEHPRAQEVLVKARAAIAKAEGREP